MHTQRANLGKLAPDLYRSIAALEKQVAERAAAAGLQTGFAHILRLRASQLNQCAFCIRMHTRDALAAGEGADRVSVVAAWRESSYFDDRERASLSLMEAVTMVADGQVADSVYEAAAATLSEEQLVAVEWLAVVINAWNRVAIASRFPVVP